MTNDRDRSYSRDGTETNRPLAADRRRFLTALGVGGAVAAAGCLGSGDEDDDESGDDDAESDDGEQNGDEPEPTIDARFGYTSTADEEAEPVEPDQTINLYIEEREEVPIPEFYFEPVGVAIEPGDTVKFTMATPHHNVNAYHPAFGYTQRVPDDTPAFSSPILAAGDAWYYTFENEGVHDVVCAPHEIYGMAGRIVVGDATGPGANPVGEAPGGEEARPPELTAGLVLSDPALDPETIVEEETVSWDDLDPESKRLLIEFPEE